MSKKRERAIKAGLLVVWITIIIFAVSKYFELDIPLDEYPQLIQDFIGQYGIWGPILYIVIYILRPLIFFPATLLTAVSGAVFGPWLGILYTIIGENLSANFAFLIARYFGRNFVKKSEGSTGKKIDQFLNENGFITTLLMRLMYFPFDLTNYACGLSSMRQRDYAIATFIGILPGLITFVLLGSSFMDPQNLILTAITFVGGLVISYFLQKRHKKLAKLKDKSKK